MKPKKIITRQENFADWYTSVINEAKLISYASVKGMISFLPNGWSIWTLIQNELNSKFAKLKIQNVQLPLFIKYSDFAQEKEHVDGFAPESFIVTKKGEEELADPLIIRPTSEVSFCQLFKELCHSYNDLPILFNQWCSVLRVEKNTRPFLRNTEFYWHEVHTIHATKKEAQNQVMKMIKLYEDFAVNFLNIPILVGEKTVNERFAGADNTYTIEALMQDGQALQCATSHFLGQNFAKIYDVKYQTSNNDYSYVYQTSAGISTRIIGAIIMSHSDDSGLILPFNVAPEQIAIISLYSDKSSQLGKKVNALYKTLSAKYRVNVDNSDKSFGYKINAHQICGTPFVIVIGPKELETNSVTLISRDNNQKQVVSTGKLNSFLVKAIKDYGNNLYQSAKKRLDDSIIEVGNIQDFTKAVTDRKFALAYWCDEPADEKKLKELTGATARCIKMINTDPNKKCFFTNKPAKALVYFARAY